MLFCSKGMLDAGAGGDGVSALPESHHLDLQQSAFVFFERGYGRKSS